MTIFARLDELKQGMAGMIDLTGGDVVIRDKEALVRNGIDDLVATAVFSPHEETKAAACWLVHRAAFACGAFAASIQSLYEAMGRGEAAGFTVPAINIRAFTYDCARAVFRAALRDFVGPFIFEIARSEIDYTFQRPREYSTAVLAAAVKEGYRGPVFIQGDHFQVNAKKYAADPDGEI
jgi:hypothetical protein